MTVSPDSLVVHLRVIGFLMAGLAGINLLVPRRFHWREEMARLSLLNRQIVQAHATFLILTLALLAWLLIATPEVLLEPSPLGRAFLFGLTVFWGLRMLMQWFFYSTELWRGDPFNTVVHVLFSIVWVYVTAVFGAAFWIG